MLRSSGSKKGNRATVTSLGFARRNSGSSATARAADHIRSSRHCTPHKCLLLYCDNYYYYRSPTMVRICKDI